MEASSSRRSSTSELPSSPLTGGAREELAPDTEDTLPRRKQAKTSSSRSMFFVLCVYVLLSSLSIRAVAY